MLYLILYDLRSKKWEAEYRLQKLISEHAEDFCEVTHSAFVVSSRLSLEDWYYLLKENLDNDDYFLLTLLSENQFTGFLSDDAVQWFSQCG